MSDELLPKPILIVPSAAVLVGAAGALAICFVAGFLMLGGGGIPAALAARGRAIFGAGVGKDGTARGFGGDTIFGAFVLFATLGTAGARIDGAGGGAVRRRGGLALGNAANFFRGGGGVIFTNGGGATGRATALGVGAFMAGAGIFRAAGFGFAMAGGGGGAMGRVEILGGGATGGLDAIIGADLIGAGGRRLAVTGREGCERGTNPAGRLNVERGGLAGGGSSDEPSLTTGLGRAERSNPGSVG